MITNIITLILAPPNCSPGRAPGAEVPVPSYAYSYAYEVLHGVTEYLLYVYIEILSILLVLNETGRGAHPYKEKGE